MQAKPHTSLNQYAASLSAMGNKSSKRLRNLKSYLNMVLQNELLLDNMQLKQQIATKKVNFAKRYS